MQATTPTYADIPALETIWLWAGRIPRGEVTLIAGEGGVGKGLLLVDLAARVSTGRPMPGTTPDGADSAGDGPGSVILITPEDDPSEAVAWRLRAAGANLTKIHDMTLLPGGGQFTLPADTGQLRHLVDTLGDVRLIIIDPLMACVDRPVATNLGARRVMAPLQRLARDAGVAAVVSHHLVKSGVIAGSRGLTDAARIVHRVTRDPENPQIRVLEVVKTNITGESAGARYTITGTGTDAKVTWVTREQVTARRTTWRDRLTRRDPSNTPATNGDVYAATMSTYTGGQRRETPLGCYTTLGAAQTACAATTTQAIQWREHSAGVHTAATRDSAGTVTAYAIAHAGASAAVA